MISNRVSNNNNNNNLRKVMMQKYKTFILINSMMYHKL